MIKLLKYLKPYLKYAVAAPLFLFVEVILELQQPRLMGDIVDIGILSRDMDFVFATGLKMIAFALIMSAGGLGCMYFSSKTSQLFGKDIRDAMFENIQTFSFSDIDKFQTASLVTRLTNDVTQIQQLVMMGLRMMIRAPLLATGGFLMAARLNLKLSAVLAAALLILTFFIVIIMRSAFPLFSMIQQKLDKVNSVMRENLSGIRVIKAFVRSDYEKKRFASANNELTNAGIKAGNIMALTFPIMIIVMNFTTVAVLWLGGYLAGAGEIEVGKILAFINYTTQILFSFLMLAFMFVFISRAYASVARINDVLSYKSSMQNPENPVKDEITEGCIEFKNVFFKYNDGDKDDDKYELRGINLKIKPGETIAILGETGSGKSTLVNLIPRLYDATSGQVLIDGRDVRSYDIETLRAGIGVVPQDTVLFSGTVAENIRWGNPDAREDEIKQYAQISQASEFLDTLPGGYNTVIGQRGIGLSGGQRQRIAIARAIIKKPKILILDDSTSAVDVMTEVKIQQGFREKLSGCTWVIIAQRISTALDADRIIVLKDGAIAEQGTHSELIAQGGIYYDIYKSQLGTEGI
jgi:ATP-binding cassette subfamily B protein